LKLKRFCEVSGTEATKYGNLFLKFCHCLSFLSGCCFQIFIVNFLLLSFCLFFKKKKKKKKNFKEHSVEAIVRCVSAIDRRSPSERVVHSVQAIDRSENCERSPKPLRKL
jgi:type I restriction-modification system DNA methylase subunit